MLQRQKAGCGGASSLRDADAPQCLYHPPPVPTSSTTDLEGSVSFSEDHGTASLYAVSFLDGSS